MLDTAYNDKLTENPELLSSLYEGLKSAFNSEVKLFIDSNGVKGKILQDKYLVIKQEECYSFYDNHYVFEYIKAAIKKKEKNMYSPVMEYMPNDLLVDYVIKKEGQGKPNFKKSIDFLIPYMATYTNSKYGIGFKTTTSLYRLRNMVNFLSDEVFIKPVPEKMIEDLFSDRVFELSNMKSMIDQIEAAATTRKHKFNDGDNAIWKTEDALIIETQSYGYHIVRQGNSMTISAYADECKKHSSLKSLVKDLSPEKLIDNVALKTKGSKVVFSDLVFTFINLTEDLEIALEEMQSKKPLKIKKK